MIKKTFDLASDDLLYKNTLKKGMKLVSQKNVTRTQRSLSPHIQIYKWQLTSVLSIVHRMTGVFLCSFAILVVAWLVALKDAESFDIFRAVLSHPLAFVYASAVAFCLFFHLANGIRHLFWDAGIGLDLKTTYRSGWTVVAISTISTVFYVFLLCSFE